MLGVGARKFIAEAGCCRVGRRPREPQRRPGWMERKREGERESDGGEGTCVCGEWMEEAVNERLRKRNNGVERFDN